MNFVELVNLALCDSDIGAEFALDKCSWVKRDGVWLSKLKFVGLVYDPFTNLLAAKTRVGATLPLFIGKARIRLKTLSDPVLDRIANLMSSKPTL